MAKNGVQDKEEQIEEFPQSWEEFVKEEPFFEKWPKLKEANEFTFEDSVGFTKAQAAMMAAYQGESTLEQSENGLPVAETVQIVQERAAATKIMVDFVKSISDDPSQIDEWLVGMDPNLLFLELAALSVYITGQLGKSVESKLSSTATKSN